MSLSDHVDEKTNFLISSEAIDLVFFYNLFSARASTVVTLGDLTKFISDDFETCIN